MNRAASLLGVAVLCACSSPSPDQSAGAPVPLNGQGPLALKAVASVAVEGRTGPGGKGFEVERRVGAIGQYPCATCHANGLSEREAEAAATRWGHADIRLAHAPGMQCATCHDYGDLGQLKSALGPVGFDHSYRVCAQCHFEQERDWAGGAHGKRLAAWKGRRVVYNCSRCHDPHAPAIAPQMPVMYPRVPRTGGH